MSFASRRTVTVLRLGRAMAGLLLAAAVLPWAARSGAARRGAGQAGGDYGALAVPSAG
jgi:hypothetical protein